MKQKINYAMPVKDGLYDFMQLAKQVTETANAHKKIKNQLSDRQQMSF